MGLKPTTCGYQDTRVQEGAECPEAWRQLSWPVPLQSRPKDKQVQKLMARTDLSPSMALVVYRAVGVLLCMNQSARDPLPEKVDSSAK